MAKLKPCPFCGGEATVGTIPIVGGGYLYAFVECLSETCNGSSGQHDTESEAISAWNRRAEPQRWIPVEERLPEDYAIVQIVEDNGYKWIPRIGEYRKCLDEWRIEGTFEHSNGWLEDTKMFKVTHWQPLPEPPTKGE